MSRWGETFAALSGGSDTLDTIRHSGDPLSIVSQSVNSVTAAPTPSVPRRAGFSLAQLSDEQQRHGHVGRDRRQATDAGARLFPGLGHPTSPSWQQVHCPAGVRAGGQKEFV